MFEICFLVLYDSRLKVHLLGVVILFYINRVSRA